ncbi:winged helix DNA-binding protein [Vibrio sp. PP-XX7]
MNNAFKNKPHLPIVSSSHLAGENSVELSEFEYALTMVNHAFQRWTLSCSTTCGRPDLSPLDILIIHNIQHRDRPKRIADVAFTLNLDDIHNVSYSVRKLAKKNLVEGVRQGKRHLLSNDRTRQSILHAVSQCKGTMPCRSAGQPQYQSGFRSCGIVITYSLRLLRSGVPCGAFSLMSVN